MRTCKSLDGPGMYLNLLTTLWPMGSGTQGGGAP